MELEVLGVRCGYDSVKVLDGVTFRVKEGDFVGVVGPNGSGKSTLLRAVSRVLKISEGTVKLGGKAIDSFSKREIARHVGVVPQNGSVAFPFKVSEVVMMGRSPHLGRFSSEGPRDHSVVRRAMERTGTLHLAGRFLDELSSGERQRVILARALAQEPKLLLLDEPTSHLDINYQVGIMDLIKSLNRAEGITVIVVIHDLNLASQYCDSLIMLKDGKVFAAGTPEEVLTEANVEAVYGTPVLITRHPVMGCPQVVLLPRDCAHWMELGGNNRSGGGIRAGEGVL